MAWASLHMAWAAWAGLHGLGQPAYGLGRLGRPGHGRPGLWPGPLAILLSGLSEPPKLGTFSQVAGFRETRKTDREGYLHMTRLGRWGRGGGEGGGARRWHAIAFHRKQNLEAAEVIGPLQ